MGCIVSESSIVIPLAKPYLAATPSYQSQNQNQNHNQNHNQYQSNHNYQNQYQQPYLAQPNYSNNANPQGQPVWQNQQQTYAVNQNY